MLLELHVRNLALIEKADVEFQQGLNILTGETGAGKSIIIGSVALALGGKAPRDCIRQGAPYAYVELIFSVDTQEKRQALARLEVEPDENGLVILSRKIMPGRSTGKINDETVTAARLRQITGLLIDIHGQHEHQSLLYKSKHLEILDDYVRSQIQPLKENTARLYEAYRNLKEELQSRTMDEEARRREQDFLEYEIREIQEAELKEGEEEELSALYRRFSHSQRIAESLSGAKEGLDQDWLSRIAGLVDQAWNYDRGLEGIRSQVYDAQSILQDAAREIETYLEDLDLDQGRFREIEERLDRIHGLQAKYGPSVEVILQKLDEKMQRLDELEHYEQRRQELERELRQKENELEQICGQLSQVRRSASRELTERIRQALLDLNFLDVKFTMEFTQLDHFTALGRDQVQFMISTNPGQPVRPLGEVASGGELSRIMLAIKTVLADSDQIPTLIFDEIDTGISGRTAQKVSEKLAYIARTHQVICITHLPQIAAMADCHFEIEKSTEGGSTQTRIRQLEREEAVEELARLLGGAQITEAVLQNAREMKELADRTK